MSQTLDQILMCSKHRNTTIVLSSDHVDILNNRINQLIRPLDMTTEIDNSALNQNSITKMDMEANVDSTGSVIAPTKSHSPTRRSFADVEQIVEEHSLDKCDFLPNKTRHKSVHLAEYFDSPLNVQTKSNIMSRPMGPLSSTSTVNSRRQQLRLMTRYKPMEGTFSVPKSRLKVKGPLFDLEVQNTESFKLLQFTIKYIHHILKAIINNWRMCVVIIIPCNFYDIAVFLPKFYEKSPDFIRSIYD